MVAVTHEWSGPLPAPSMLAEYNAVLPDGAERIVRQWEGETTHRHALEDAEIRIFGLNALLGRIFALIFCLAALGVIAYAAYLGAQWLAGILGAGLIGSVVAAFLRTHRDGASDHSK